MSTMILCPFCGSECVHPVALNAEPMRWEAHPQDFEVYGGGKV
jgi:hypothetical protein